MSDTDEKKRSWFGRLKAGLARSSNKISDGITGIFNKRRLDDEALAELEELLISADLGWGLAKEATQRLRHAKFNQEVAPEEIRIALAQTIEPFLEPVEQPLMIDPANKPHVILVVGANGSGKTTTIGKLAKIFRDDGKSVVLAAGDTFRAAAVEQLQIWGQRAGVPVIVAAQGADAAGLAFDALAAAKRQGADILLIDTAGRLHNKTDLMAELQKIQRVIKKLDPTAPHSVLLVLDATIGQTALQHIQTFRDLVGITGIVMTKLDGSARGGVLVALAEMYTIPVPYIGLGEAIDDLRPFEAAAFARGLVGLDRQR
ncbi:MAG TPA: signal recognition particle-docking protein FtsY [Stellaceae bacterium]